MEEKHFYAVSSIGKRDYLIKKIRDNLLSHVRHPLKVLQPQVNKLQVVHFASEGVWITIRTYLVLVIPLIVDISPLQESMIGNCNFHLGGLIKELEGKIKELRLLSGQHTVEENKNETIARLAGSLSEIYGEDRIGKSL